jgi:ribosomal protein L24
MRARTLDERRRFWAGRSRRRRKERSEQSAQWHLIRVAEGKEAEAAEDACRQAVRLGETGVEALAPARLPDGYAAVRVAAKPSVVEAITSSRLVFTFVEGLSTGFSEAGSLQAPGADAILKGRGAANRAVHKRARLIQREAHDNGEEMEYDDALSYAAEELQNEAVSEDSSAGQGYGSLEELFRATGGSAAEMQQSQKKDGGGKVKDRDIQAPYSDNADDDEVRDVFEQQLRQYEQEREEELLRKEGKVLGRSRRNRTASQITRQPDSDIDKSTSSEQQQQQQRKPQRRRSHMSAQQREGGSSTTTTASASSGQTEEREQSGRKNKGPRKGDTAQILDGRNKGLEGSVLSVAEEGADPKVTILTKEPNFGAEMEVESLASNVHVTKKRQEGKGKHWRQSSRQRPRKRLTIRAEEEEAPESSYYQQQEQQTSKGQTAQRGGKRTRVRTWGE